MGPRSALASRSFGPVAPFYDKLMAGVPYGMWKSYYELLLTTIESRPKRILDVCCGTGTLCEMFAREGKLVAGIDLSAPMIEEARRKADRLGLNIRYEAADAASFELHEKFDAAYSFFDSLNYITDLGRLQLALIRVGKHLQPGGSFIFDLNTAYAFEAKMFDQADTRKRSEVHYKWKGDYDPSARIIKVDMRFWVGDQEFHETHIQRAHSTDEIMDRLTVAGFESFRVYDSYTLDPPRKNSDRIHIVAVLPKG